MKYALVAAIFIAVRDVFSSKIARKYNYIDYIVHANVFVFIATMFYVLFTKKKIKVITDYNDLFIILLKLLIIYIIIEPCIFNAFKNSSNPSKPASIISLNLFILLIITVIFLKQKMNLKQYMGILVIMGGVYLIR